MGAGHSRNDCSNGQRGLLPKHGIIVLTGGCVICGVKLELIVTNARMRHSLKSRFILAYSSLYTWHKVTAQVQKRHDCSLFLEEISLLYFYNGTPVYRLLKKACLFVYSRSRPVSCAKMQMMQ